MSARTCRIAMYSHDAVGIGHLRRSLLVARALSQGCEAARGGSGAGGAGTSTLLVSGVYEASAFTLPPGVDCLTLPALRKVSDGTYQPRRLTVPATEVLSVRASAIRGALEAFKPDVLIVDKLPRGVGREMDPSLEMLRRRGRTRCVLGLRDILDEPAVVRREWEQDAGEQTVTTCYDAVWVYGSPRVYDTVKEYGFSHEVAAKVRYTGYFDSASPEASEQTDGGRDPLTALNLAAAPFALCMVGGGEDGGLLAEAFAGAPLPRGMNAVLVTGPFMPADVRRRLRYQAEGRPRLRVIEFTPAARELIRRAARVVAMGGYNTVWEILSYGKPALIAPRVKPRQEQLIRAERLRDMGLVDVLLPHQVSPTAIGGWLVRDPRHRPRAADVADLDGLRKLPGLLAELLASPPMRPGDSISMSPNPEGRVEA